MASYASVWKWEANGWRLAATLFNGAPGARPDSNTQPRSLAPLSPAGPAAGFIEADLAFARLATTSSPAEAFRTFASPDAVLFSGANELVRGKDEIGQLFANLPPVDWTWHPVLAGAAPDGSLGFTVGESTRRRRGDAAAPAELSKYLSVWRRDPDGTVRYLFDGGNQR
jgi:ketosteroid isomerase-like protein